MLDIDPDLIFDLDPLLRGSDYLPCSSELIVQLY